MRMTSPHKGTSLHRGYASLLLLMLVPYLNRLTTCRVTATTRSHSALMTSSEVNPYSKGSFLHRSLQDGEEMNEVLSPYYYDDLRIMIENATSTTNSSNQNELVPIVARDENSTIYQVTLNSNNDTNSDVTYRLVELKSFIAYTKGASNIEGAQDEAFAVLLAMYHFNNMVQLQNHPLLGDQIFSPFTDDGDITGTATSNDTSLSTCNVKLTIELLDSTYSPTIATQTIASVLERTTSISVPETTAVVSSSPTTVTLPLAILTGINDVPFMSATATSTGFDDKEQFPVFGRTVTNADGIAAMSLKFFQSVIQSSHVAILFVTDSFGSDIQKAFQEEATLSNIVTESIAFSRNITEKEAQSVFESLIRLQYHHVYMICYPDQLELLLTVASNLTAIGPEYLYIFPGLNVYGLERNLRTMDGSVVNKAIQGIGIIQMSAGITSDRVTQGKVAAPTISDNPTTGFERFRLAWKYALQDIGFRQYVQSKLPESFVEMTDFEAANYFIQDPIGLHAFIYDTITAFGVSMCRTNSSRNFFEGQDIYEQLRELDIVSASGNVRMTSTGTRNHSSVAFVVWNVRSVGVDSDGMSILEYVPSFGSNSDKWFVLPGNEFTYADGSETPPESLPLIDHDYNYITSADRIFGYTLMSIILALSVGAIIWTVSYRKNHVVDAAQPLFLIIVFVGAFIMALTTIPAGFDETIISSMNGLDASCMAIPWLYFVGSNLSTGALLAKTKAVYEAYVDPEIDTIHVSSLDIIKSVLYQLIANFVILLLWTLIAPLEWTRVDKDATDNFDRQLESIGNCAASGQSLTFAIIVLVVNMAFLILGTFWAYKSRNITTEYDESMYIGLCIVAVLQTWTIGLPILVVVRDNPSVSFYVQSGLVFVTSLAVIGFAFFPKVFAVRKDRANDRKEVYKEFKRAAILRQRAEEEDSERDPNHVADLPITETKTTGIKVLHNPRSQRNLALSGGIELSRRQLQIWEDAMSDENAGSDDKMEQIPEDGIDDSNCESCNYDPLSRSLQKLPESTEDADNNDSLDNEKNVDLAAQYSEDAENDEHSVTLPSESAESAAETTPKSDCLNGENHEPSR